MTVLKIALLSVTTALLSPALAQDVTVWGGVGTEALFIPTASLGLSGVLGHVGGVGFGLRATAGVSSLFGTDSPPLVLLGAELLLSGSTGPINVYGGPGVAFTPSGGGLVVGAVGGVQGQFGTSPWGWFSEVKLRYDLTPNDGSRFNLVLPGVNLGVTYRF